MPKFSRALWAAALCAAGVSLVAQSDLNYDANADFLTMPANTYLGEVAGVASNSKGHVFVYTRTGHAVATLGDERTFYHGGSRLFQFDQNGKFVKEIGQGTVCDQLRAAGAGRSAGQHLDRRHRIVTWW